MELEAENWRLCSTTLVRGVAVELEYEKWRLGSALGAHVKREEDPTPETQVHADAWIPMQLAESL